MLKVCMVVHQYYDTDPRVRRYAESLVAAGARVDVLCARNPEWPATGDRRGVRVFTIPLRRHHGNSFQYALEYLASLLLYAVTLTWLWARHGYDVVHVHNMPDALVFCAMVPKLFGAKVVLDIHDPMPEVYQSKYKAAGDSLLVRLMSMQERAAGWFADAVITANQRFARAIVDRGLPEERLSTIRNLPDERLFRRHRRRGPCSFGRFRLIYPGTIAPRYGLEVAIRAMPALARAIPQIRLCILGRSVAHGKELRALAGQLEVSDHVCFHGSLPLERVPEQLAASDVGIYTALSDPHMDVAPPTKVLEYAVMGLPIVASRLPVVEDLLGANGGLLFDAGSSRGFADAVIALYRDPELRRRCVAEADAVFVNQHSWRRECEQYFELLRRLTARARETLGQTAQTPELKSAS